MAKKQNIITKKSEKFLEKYLNNPSPTGFEAEGQKIWLNYLKPYIDEHFVDSYGSVVGVINPKAKYKVVIEAHADEISWFVHYINPQGFIYLKRNGGSDHQIAPSKRVVIHTDKGLVTGLFGWPAIHTRTPSKEETPKVKNLFLDVGAKDAKEVEKMGIHVGCVVTYPDEFMILNKKWYVGRALDNRAGGFMIASEDMKHISLSWNVLQVRGASSYDHGVNFICGVIEDIEDRTSPSVSHHFSEGLFIHKYSYRARSNYPVSDA